MEQQVGILRAQLARKTGCNLETIRYYEKVGLLPGPPRSSNGYRVYSPELVQRLQFILRARDLGYAMDEIRSLLSLTDVTPSEIKNSQTPGPGNRRARRSSMNENQLEFLTARLHMSPPRLRQGGTRFTTCAAACSQPRRASLLGA